MSLTQGQNVWQQSLPSLNHRLDAWHGVGVHVSTSDKGSGTLPKIMISEL